MTTAGERIIEIIKDKGLNVKTFSEVIGYDRPQALYDLIKGRTRNISAAMTDRIIATYPDINKVWLVTGEGKMIGKDESASADRRIPLVPIGAIAGPLTSYYESGVDLTWCQYITAPIPGAEIAIPISGDSMEPLFADGSVIYIKRINEAAFIPWGHPLVIDTENGVFIKNVMPDNDDLTYIWAESVNPKYPPMHIPKQSIAGMYRVLSVSRTFTTM